MKRRAFISGALGLGGAMLAATMLAQPPIPGLTTRRELHDGDASLYSGADLAFGTTISIHVVHPDQRQAELAIQDALAAAKNIDRLMTLHRVDSQVAILNRTGELRHPDSHLRVVLQHAIALSRLTDGAFDITVQPLWEAYSAAASRGAGMLPSDAARRSAMALVDWRQVALADDRIALQRAGMAITLNGIAQGYAVDVARAALEARGIRHAFLDTGEFAARGRKHDAREWTVGIRDPRDSQTFAAVVPLRGRCVATSGDYETAFTPDFAHHHIFDPASGDSPPELASVTVAAATGLEADGLSTALMVLGPRKAMALAASLPHVDVLLIEKQGAQWRSNNLS